MELVCRQNELIHLQVGSLWSSVHFRHVTWKTSMWGQASVQAMIISPTVTVSPANRQIGRVASQHSHSSRKIRGYLRPWWSQYNLQHAKRGISSPNVTSNFNPKIFLQVNCFVHVNSTGLYFCRVFLFFPFWFTFPYIWIMICFLTI
jgi:hypothetical protein